MRLIWERFKIGLHKLLDIIKKKKLIFLTLVQLEIFFFFLNIFCKLALGNVYIFVYLYLCIHIIYTQNTHMYFVVHPGDSNYHQLYSKSNFFHTKHYF